MRRYGNRRRMPVKTGPAQSPVRYETKAYVPDVVPFMRQYGYRENLEDILQEIDRLPQKNHFYYEKGDLWRRNP